MRDPFLFHSSLPGVQITCPLQLYSFPLAWFHSNFIVALVVRDLPAFGRSSVRTLGHVDVDVFLMYSWEGGIYSAILTSILENSCFLHSWMSKAQQLSTVPLWN